MHAILTGASSGIGAALARELAAHGYTLTLVARRAALLDALASELPVQTHRIVRDLSEMSQATDWLAEAEAALGPVDVLINNAGVQIVAAAAETDPEAGERLLRLNLLTPMRLMRAVLPGMLARKRGTLVNISSMAGIAPTPGMFYYNASKAGLGAASEALFGELRGTGVTTCTVYPGYILETDMGAAGYAAYDMNFAARMQPNGKASVLARKVRKAIEGRSQRVIYPWFNVFGRHLPGPTRWLMDRLTPPVKRLG